MPMGRTRQSDKHLPPRVYVHHGSYRYVPKTGPKVTLAKVGDYGGMLRALAALVDVNDTDLSTLSSVMSRYLETVTPTKCAGLQRKEPKQMARLRAVFGHFRPGDLEVRHAYAYHAKRGLKYPVAATREIELLRHVLTMAMRWGWPPNPLLRMDLEQPKPRRHYVTDEVYAEVWNMASSMMRCAMDLAVLTALRRGDLLGLTRTKNVTDAGLLVRPTKTQGSSGVELLFEWTPTLRDVIKRAQAEPPQVRQAIICNRHGRPYSGSGFDKAWQRLMREYVKAGGERFQFKDLRKKSASDTVEASEASARLGHSNQAITDRVYRLKPRVVRPLR